jgi:hypothetical protein
MPSLMTPPVDSTVALQADYLEFCAFISSTGTIAVASLAGEQDLLFDTDGDPDRDALLEEARASVTNEFARRKKVLEGAYPFKVLNDGDTLSLVPNSEWHIGCSAYLLSLILSHATDSEILPKEAVPTAALLRESRDLFQICATIAAAGYCDGPSYSMGWPRPDRSNFLTKLKAIWADFRDGAPRDEPLPVSSEEVKDEGIDVIAWRAEPDKKPCTLYILAQVASGNNWKSKSVLPDINRFHREWFTKLPVSTPHPAMMIPFLLDSDCIEHEAPCLGHIFDRDRVPRYANRALSLGGKFKVERLEDMNAVRDWIVQHQHNVQASVS